MKKDSLSYFKKIGDSTPLNELMEKARILRDQKGTPITFSKKVFIPLTMLCRDVCHYCTFAKVPRKLAHPYLRSNEVLDIAKQELLSLNRVWLLKTHPFINKCRNWILNHLNLQNQRL